MSSWPFIKVLCDLGDFGVLDGLNPFNPIPYLDPPLDTLPNDAYDLTNYVQRIKTRVGLRDGRRVAEVNEAEIWLDGVVGDGSSGRIFAPENSLGSGLKIGRVIAFQVSTTGSPLSYGNLFTGRIIEIRPESASQRTYLRLVGRWFWAQFPVSVPTQVNALASDVATAVLNAASVPPFTPHSYDVVADEIQSAWIITDETMTGPGLNHMYVAYDNTLGSTISGYTVYPYILDQYASAPASKVISDIVEAEVGVFYEDFNGFFNLFSHSDFYSAPSGSFLLTESDLIGHGYSYGKTLMNEVRMRFIPRRVVTGSVLWTSATPIYFKEGTTTFNVRTLGTDGRVVGLLNTPYISNWVFIRALDFVQVTCQVLVTQIGAGVSIEVHNDTAGGRVYLQVGALLVGSALVQEPPMEIVERDSLSIWLHGLRSRTFDLGLVSDPDVARDTARYMLSLDSRPRGEVGYVDLQNDTATLLSYMILPFLRTSFEVQLGSVGHYGFYQSCGVEHDIELHSKAWKTRIHMESAREGGFWLMGVVGFSELDVSTRLGF